MANDATTVSLASASARVYCPGCASLLATPLAMQCFRCGLDWHNEDSPANGMEKSAIATDETGMLTRRSWLRQFARLMVATLAAQIAALALFVLLFQEPQAFLVAVVIGVPIYMWLDVRMGRLAEANRLTASVGKLAALAVGILALTLPERFLPIAIGVFLTAGLCGSVLVPRIPSVPASAVRLLVLVALGLAVCQALGIGPTIAASFLATISLIEFGGLMLALDAWEKRTRRAWE